jgi:hypothetical protein
MSADKFLGKTIYVAYDKRQKKAETLCFFLRIGDDAV